MATSSVPWDRAPGEEGEEESGERAAETDEGPRRAVPEKRYLHQRRLPARGRRRAASIIASTDPSGAPRSANPRAPFPKRSCSLT